MRNNSFLFIHLCQQLEPGVLRILASSQSPPAEDLMGAGSRRWFSANAVCTHIIQHLHDLPHEFSGYIESRGANTLCNIVVRPCQCKCETPCKKPNVSVRYVGRWGIRFRWHRSIAGEVRDVVSRMVSYIMSSTPSLSLYGSSTR